MGLNLALRARSAACRALFRLHGFQSSDVVCIDRLPLVYGEGSVLIRGKLVVRCRIAQCEIGAAENGRLEIGHRVVINQGASIVAHHWIEVGDDARIGDFVAVYDSNFHAVDPHHPVRSAPVTIGANAWLGRGVMVMPGSKIGDHTVVAAGSVVTGELPPRVLAAGSPARVVRELDIPDGWRRG